uniref:Uncharacterized protein n=1 Tax=Meloidogyne enterolobii TaxID=390850 RepID=A0A6V7WRA7_MELEN|nr:unnamed protein product [Meloidogyne enterolobii]
MKVERNQAESVEKCQIHCVLSKIFICLKIIFCSLSKSPVGRRFSDRRIGNNQASSSQQQQQFGGPSITSGSVIL